MVITPDSKVKLIKNPLKLDSNNEITFSSATAQYNYFNSLPKLEFDNLTYIRKDNILKIETDDNLTFEDLLGYNFCMYQNTHFDNTNGLDDTTETHLTSSRDIALMSRELIVKYPSVLNYTTLWQDSLRDGAFVLSNTNKLIRFYDGANGLKTGFTQKSGYCISASAKRGELQLIAVVMGAESSDKRNVAIKEMFDYGFANYTAKTVSPPDAIELPIIGGKCLTCKAVGEGFHFVMEKDKKQEITTEYIIPDNIKAPIYKGDAVGKIVYRMGSEIIREENLTVTETVEKMTLIDMLLSTLRVYFALT